MSSKSIEESIPINFDAQQIEWRKSLEGMPVFTVTEIGDLFEKTSDRPSI